jgi:medium-chain acyl-[acyl-carrier-protein] hydrolase
VDARAKDALLPWVIRPAPRAHARLRLFCFPSAGGGAAQYRPWVQQLPDDIELCAVQLPGRESRLREAPQRRLAPIVAAAGDALAPLLDIPCALFGHSMGALLAFEVAHRLRRQGLLPLHLFVSGRRAPQLPDPDPALHALEEAAFVREIVRRYNGIPRVILEDAEMLQLFLPTLRADLEVIETYIHAGEEPLPCPITAFGGLDDGRARHADLEAWRAQTTRSFRSRQFPGDHFYLQSQRSALLAEIAETLAGGAPQPAREAEAGRSFGVPQYAQD